MTGVKRVEAAFRRAAEEQRTAIVPYLVAGYPNLAATKRHVLECAEAGADVIELGIPFSDPVADGPTIQAAITESLEGGTRPGDVLRLVQDLREAGLETPIVAMTYANLFFAPGWGISARRLARAGVDGTIVPDVPLEESRDYRRAWREEGLATVFLASPATSGDRLRRIARASTGFFYLVAVYGTTGARERVASETRDLLRRTAVLDSDVARCVGFGVSRPEHVVALAGLGADGVVVGSALVDQIRRGRRVKSFVAGLRARGTRLDVRGRPGGQRPGASASRRTGMPNRSGQMII